MPSWVTKSGKRVCVARVQKDRGIRTAVFRTKAEALAWEAEEKAKDWTTDTISLRLGDFANEYLDFSRSKHSDKTYHEKSEAFRRLFLDVNPDNPVEKLTPIELHKVLRKRASEKTGNAANKDRKNLVAAWNWGIKYLGLPRLNPCLVDRFPEIRKPRYVPPEQDFWKVYDLTQGQDRAMLAVAIYLAARRGEIYNLTWSDVDFDRRLVRLGTRKRMDGSLEYEWLPMAEELEKELRAWWHNRTFRQAIHVFVCEGRYQFSLPHHGQPFKVRRKFMNKLCEKAKVKPFGWHAIRHLGASILFRLGYPPSVIQVILRHKNPLTTTRYLRSLGLEDVRPAVDSLGRSRSSGDVLEFKTKQPPEAPSSEGHSVMLPGQTVSETVSTQAKQLATTD